MWEFLTSDRGLAYVAIVIGLAGILRADWLFHKLYKREKYIRTALLTEANMVLISYASFSRALQGLEISESEMTKDGAFATLTCFRFQQLLYPEMSKEQFAELRTATRAQIEKGAIDYAEMLIGSGIGKLREGVELNHKLKK